MDPASAIIGLSASLATLSGLVLGSFKTLYKAQGHFKDAPQEIGRLCRRLQEFDALLKEFRSQLDVAPGTHASAVQVLAAASVQHMEEDLKELNNRSRQLYAILNSSTTKRKSLALRLRHVFTESKVTHYQQLISTHSGTMMLLLNMNNNHKLDQLSKQLRPALPVDIQPPKHRAREIRAAGEPSHTTKIHTVKLPFGVTAASTTTIHTRSEQNGGRLSQIIHRFTFVPPKWLSDLILQWDFKLERNSGNFPSLGLSLSPIRYNTDTRLAAAVKSCDASQIRHLLKTGLARADDYIVIRNRPVQLLEAIAPRSASCEPKRVLETYQCLLESDAYKNNANLMQSHAQVLITLAKGSNVLLESALDVFCSHGGSILWYEAVSPGCTTESPNTILSLISRHGAGFYCLEKFLFRQSDPWTAEDLSIVDRWLFGTLAAVSQRFRRSLESYLRSYWSVFSVGRSQSNPLEPFNLSKIISEVDSAPGKYRIEFLKILVKWGTKEMVEPFFSAGFIDIDESVANDMFPWLRLSYLSKAVRWGNVNTFEYLLARGACPIRCLAYLSRFPDAVPQASKKGQDDTIKMTLKIANRALSVDIKGLLNVRGSLDHDLLLALLLRTSHLRPHSSLIADQLVQRLINDNIDYITSHSEAPVDAYILFSIILDLPTTLKLFVQTAIEQTNVDPLAPTFSPFDPIPTTFTNRLVAFKARPSLNGFSWTSLAVELARPECLQILLDSNDSKGLTSSTVFTVATSLFSQQRGSIRASELDQADVNLPAEQPDYSRATVAISTWPCQIPQRLVEEREDQSVSKVLQEWIHNYQVRVGAKGVESIWTRRYPNRASEGFDVSKRGHLPKLVRRVRSIVAFMIASAIQILRLHIWEMVILSLTYIITLGLFIIY